MYRPPLQRHTLATKDGAPLVHWNGASGNTHWRRQQPWNRRHHDRSRLEQPAFYCAHVMRHAAHISPGRCRSSHAEVRRLHLRRRHGACCWLRLAAGPLRSQLGGSGAAGVHAALSLHGANLLLCGQAKGEVRLREFVPLLLSGLFVNTRVTQGQVDFIATRTRLRLSSNYLCATTLFARHCWRQVLGPLAHFAKPCPNLLERKKKLAAVKLRIPMSFAPWLKVRIQHTTTAASSVETLAQSR